MAPSCFVEERRRSRRLKTEQDAAAGNANQEKRVTDFKAKLASRPDLYDRIEVVKLPTDGGDIVPPGSVDLVVTFRKPGGLGGCGGAAWAKAGGYSLDNGRTTCYGIRGKCA